MSMDSPSNTTPNSSVTGNPFAVAMAMATGLPLGAVSLANLPPTTTSSSGNETPQPVSGASQSSNSNTAAGQPGSNNNNSHSGYAPPAVPPPPTAAEITRRINSKRRRDDDLDPISFKRRAVSPGMSVHNSPVMQSPLQRDMAPWGSRPGSNAGERDFRDGQGGRLSGSSAVSENGSQAGCGSSSAQGNAAGSGGGGGAAGGGGGSQGRVNGGKARVGYQGMVDTNDGITKLSIE
jgi:hypothetical protein